MQWSHKVQKYRKIKALIENNEYNEKLDLIIENTDEIIKSSRLLEKETLTIIKSLPELLDSDKKKDKLEKFIQNDMLNYLYNNSELNALFESRTQKETILKIISDNFNEVIAGGIKKESWQLLKDTIKSVASKEGIKNEHIGVCTIKLFHQLVATSYKFLVDPEY